jgi:peptidoglycan/xylan/chitin deacetylase (PgdA/CDA1 family)
VKPHIEEPTGPGMDHALYPFRAAPDAPQVTWPDGSKLAFFVLLHLEAWELTPPADAHRDPRFVAEFPAFHPDYRAWSAREYGNRVGIFRVLAALDEAGIVPAVALSAASARLHRELVAACQARGSEFLAHGTWATRMITSRMSEAEERAHIADSRDAVAAATGTTPTGWVSQDQSHSTRTPRLLAEAGFDHLIDWPNDDAPFLMAPGLVSIPAQPEWDDVGIMWLKRMSPAAWAANAEAAFRALHAQARGAVFHLPLHPWVAGQAHRIRYVRALLRGLAAVRGTWHATPSQIAAHWRSTST